MRAKLSERVAVSITYEMGLWLDEIVRQSGSDGRSATMRALLTTIMEEDIRAHSDDMPTLRAVEGG